MKKLFVATVIATSFVTTAWAESVNYNPETQARIRIYGQNQYPTILKFMQDGKKQTINHGGSFGSALRSFTHTAKNVSLGIPATEYSQNLSKQNGILSKMTFLEVAIPVNTPISIRTPFNGLTNTLQTPSKTIVQYQGSCEGQKLVFTPMAGKDYEVIPSKDTKCTATILEIQPNGETAAVAF